jgi:hypothetical protein
MRLLGWLGYRPRPRPLRQKGVARAVELGWRP